MEKAAKPVEKQKDDKDNLDMLSLTDLELGVDQKDHDQDVFAGSWFELPGNKTIAGLSGFTVSMDGDNVTLTPVDYGNKVLQKTPSGKYAQYVQPMKRGLDQGAAGGMGGMPPMGGGMM